MYRITVQTLTGSEHTIYVPGNEEYIVTSAVLSLSVGSVGEFTFTVPLGNPRYNEIVDHSIITVYEDHAEIWRGDIQDIKTNFDKSLTVYCLEDMAWLGESAVAMTAITDQTYGQRFSAAINAYNANQVAKRQFTAGQLTSITTTNICTWKPQYEEDLLSCLRNYIADDGYVRIRRAYTGTVLTRYVDIVKLSDYGQQADQTIEFGSNLLDFVKEMDNTNFLNVIYPYGKETETPLYGDIMQRIVGTPQENAVSIAAFGRRERSVIFETDSLARLNSLAQSYLNRYSQPIVKLEIKAIDLGNIEIINKIRLGDSVHIIAAPFGIDQWSYATKQELNLLDIADNQITLADAVRAHSLTSQVIEQAQEIEKAQTPASILDEAKRNAWAIFEGDNGGIVTFDINGDEQIVGIHIANNLDIDQATKAWGWNINGLVYLHRDYPTDDWTVGIAMTMDGSIVADYITTGTMSADRVRTGNLESHNYSYSSGNFNIAGTIIDLDDGLIRTPGFKADGAGNVYIANGAVIGGYAKDSDIPDVSDFATKTGLSIPNYTLINGNNILTGSISANRIQGGTMIVGGIDNIRGVLASIESISWSADVFGIMVGSQATHNFIISNYEGIWLRVMSDSHGPGIIVGKYKINNGEWDYLCIGDMFLGTADAAITVTIDSTYYGFDYKFGYSTIKTYIDNNGVVADNLVARNTGYIGDLVINGREIYETGDYILNEISYKGSQNPSGYKTLAKFYPNLLYVSEPFYVTVEYEVNYNPSNVNWLDLQYFSNGWQTVESKNLDFSAGVHTVTYSNALIQNTDTKQWRLYSRFGTLSISLELSFKIYLADIKTLSFSDSGNYGTFIGRFTGSASLDTSTSIGNIEFDDEHIFVDDNSAYFDISKNGFKSAESSSTYVDIHTSNPTIKVYDGSSEYIDISRSYFKSREDSSKYIEISNYPYIRVYNSSDNYIDLDADSTELRLNASSNKYVQFRGGNDLYSKRSSSSTWSIAWTSSDRRNKEEIEPLDVELSKNLIDATETKQFKYKDADGKHYGMIAQDVRELLDNLGETDAKLEYCVNEEDEYNPRNIHYTEYIPHLINYVKALRAEIEALKNIINTLKED